MVIMGRASGSWRVYLGQLGNLPWGLRHWGMVWGHLRGPPWCLLAKGWFSRGGGDGGARGLPLPLPSDRG